ncbi:hypothetical protein MNEG_10399, partial [Monoraphidium neglectum]
MLPSPWATPLSPADASDADSCEPFAPLELLPWAPPQTPVRSYQRGRFAVQEGVLPAQQQQQLLAWRGSAPAAVGRAASPLAACAAAGLVRSASVPDATSCAIPVPARVPVPRADVGGGGFTWSSSSSCPPLPLLGGESERVPLISAADAAPLPPLSANDLARCEGSDGSGGSISSDSTCGGDGSPPPPRGRARACGSGAACALPGVACRTSKAALAAAAAPPQAVAFFRRGRFFVNVSSSPSAPPALLGR